MAHNSRQPVSALLLVCDWTLGWQGIALERVSELEPFLLQVLLTWIMPSCVIP